MVDTLRCFLANFGSKIRDFQTYRHIGVAEGVLSVTTDLRLRQVY